jgi:hypothetical protein
VPLTILLLLIIIIIISSSSSSSSSGSSSLHYIPANCPTSLPPQAIWDRAEEIINTAGAAGVKILCLQEAW